MFPRLVQGPDVYRHVPADQGVVPIKEKKEIAIEQQRFVSLAAERNRQTFVKGSLYDKERLSTSSARRRIHTPFG